MKHTIKMFAVAGLLSAATYSEIAINDNFKVSGFLDMSAQTTKWTTPDSSDGTASLDQVELDFMYDFKNNVTAQADLNTSKGVLKGDPADPTTFGNDMGITLEQAFLTVTPKGGPLSITAGKFLSSTGWECAEPVCLYQFSVAKAYTQYGGYQNGLAFNYAQSMFNVYASIVGSVWESSNTDISRPGFEGQVSVMPTEAVTVKVAYAMDTENSTGLENQSLLNAWVSGKFGPALLAAEFNMLSNWGAKDNSGMSYLAMLNYGITDKIGVTARYSAYMDDTMDAAGANPDNEFCISPGIVINDNWAALAEFNMQLEAEVMQVAVETIYSF